MRSVALKPTIRYRVLKAVVEYAWGAPLGRGRIRTVPEDFRVTEQLGYEPSGSGEHLWVDVEKRELNTLDVASRLAELAGVSVRAVGFAGLKDRNAVTRQPFTIQLPGQADPDVTDWSDDSMTIVSVNRHSRKIQRGRLKGNSFALTVRDVNGDRDGLEHRLGLFRDHGVPNRFGDQRFGGNNVARAHRMFSGELKRKPSRAKRGFYLSAARSLIFNRVLDERIRRGDWNKAVDGDVLMLDGTHSIFPYDAGDDAIPERIETLDLHPTGPLYGVGETAALGTAAAIEAKAIEAEAELAAGLVRFGTRMDRRALRMRIGELAWSFHDDATLRLEFNLPSGAFATTILDQLLETIDGSRDTPSS